MNLPNLLHDINGIVIKVGTKAITTDHSIDSKSIENVAKHTAKLTEFGKKVTIVTSGAIAAGRRELKIWGKRSLKEKQMLAAVGQPILMREYAEAFDKYGLSVAQFLVSADNFEVEQRLRLMKRTYNLTQKQGLVPIFNENDPIAVEEIRFGDNDHLQLLIATELPGNDLLVNLTRYLGLLKQGRLVHEGTSYSTRFYGDLSRRSKEGKGGLKDKLKAIRKANESGKTCIIGDVMGDIVGMITGSYKHTRFSPH